MRKYNLSHAWSSISEGNNNVALVINSVEYTYSQLERDSNKFASYFVEIGLKTNDVICLSSEKKYESFVTLIACLKLGVTYSFFDKDSPQERLNEIINTCMPALIIHNQHKNNQFFYCISNYI